MSEFSLSRLLEKKLLNGRLSLWNINGAMFASGKEHKYVSAGDCFTHRIISLALQHWQVFWLLAKGCSQELQSRISQGRI